MVIQGKKINLKKSQAAVEFLMTYGWAMMVIMGAMGTLVYLGVFDLQMFVVEKCEFASGIYCIDGLVESGKVSLAIQNGMPVDIENVEVYLKDCAPGPATGPGTIVSGEQEVYELVCTEVLDYVFKGNVIFNYTNPDSGFNHSKIGNLVYRIS